MSLLGDIGGNQPNNHGEIELYTLSLVQVRDTECDVVGWRLKEDFVDLKVSSNRLFDSVDEAFEDWQQSRKEDELMLPVQNFPDWQQSPQQGTIPTASPFAPADEQYLLEVLTECRAKLDSALATAKRYSRLPDLNTALADSITAIHKAAAIVIEPETYLE